MQKLAPARLLENGGTITVGPRPHLTFTYAQLMTVQPSYGLSHLQRQEVEKFRDRYIVTDRTIGDGAHAVVFVATEVQSGQHVVCKVHDISRFFRASPEVQRIRQEAALLSTLDHPNILPIKAAFETDQTMYDFSFSSSFSYFFSLFFRTSSSAEGHVSANFRTDT
ncbi:hypothetical protein VTK56DRAFT_9309 [Thermocarpiscus australiensis]